MTLSSFTFQRQQCLQPFMLSKGDDAFIYISKTTMSSVIYAFKRWRCLHLHFEDDNVFSHLCFQKATMPSFTFRRWQCLQSFMLSKGGNAFIYISKDDNVFSHLCFQKMIMSSAMYAFQRWQCLHLKDFNVFCPCLCFIGLDVLYFYDLKKKGEEELRCPHVFLVSHPWFSPVAQSNSQIAQTKLVSLSLLPFYWK